MGETFRTMKAKWLLLYFYGEIGCFVLSLLHYLPVYTGWVSWPQRFLMVGMIVCLFQLSPLNPRYKKAGILRAVQLICTLINVALSAHFIHNMSANLGTEDTMLPRLLTSVPSLVAMVASWVATYQIFYSHSETVKEKDPILAKKWQNLFLVTICVSLLISFVSSIISTIMILLETNTNTIVSIVQTLIGLTDRVVELVGILYLWRTVKILTEVKEEIENG